MGYCSGGTASVQWVGVHYGACGHGGIEQTPSNPGETAGKVQGMFCAAHLSNVLNHTSHALYEKNKKILEVPFHTKYSISSTV